MAPMKVRLKRYQKGFEHSYAFGVYPTLELLARRPGDVLGVVISPRAEANAGARRIARLCGERGVEVLANDRTLERLGARENDYAVGVFRKYAAALDAAADHVALVGAADMGNLGTILRTMAGFGVADLALVGSAPDINHPRVVRASMGAVFRCRREYFDTFDAYRARHERSCHPLITGAATPIRAAEFARPWTLIFGGEGPGLPDEFAQVGTPLSIPQTDAIDSLNLSVAVGIALYEAAGRGAAS